MTTFPQVAIIGKNGMRVCLYVAIKEAMMLFIILTCLSGCSSTREKTQRKGPFFTERFFIDHFCLRYMSRLIHDGKIDMEGLKAEAERLKKNMTEASRYGMNSFVIFSRSFEELVAYDLLDEKIVREGTERRKIIETFGDVMHDVFAHGKKLGLKVIFHTNQLEFPKEIYGRFSKELAGTAKVCPGKELTWKLFRAKIKEFFVRFPECDGLQITTSETQVKVTSCQCDSCRDMSAGERFARLVVEAHKVTKAMGKELQVRTWGGLEDVTSYEVMLKLLPPDVIVSTKNTLGDFSITKPVTNLLARGDNEQVIEFDSWREYTGWNQFPCYMGDIFAERLRLCAEKGIRRVAVRINWGVGHNRIFDIPWGNLVNVYLFSELSKNPYRNPDDILEEWLTKTYPPKAVPTAKKLYKFSTKAQTTWLTFLDHNCNDHSRAIRPRSSSPTHLARTERLVSEERLNKLLANPGLLDKRRKEIDRVYNSVTSLLDKLKPDIPSQWYEDMSHMAENQRLCAQVITDQLALYLFAKQGEGGIVTINLDSLEEHLKNLTNDWKSHDSTNYELMYGPEGLKMLQKMKPEH